VFMMFTSTATLRQAHITSVSKIILKSWKGQKLEYGEWLLTPVLKDVPHRQRVFSIPKRLRGSAFSIIESCWQNCRSVLGRLIQKIYEVDPLLCLKCQGLIWRTIRSPKQENGGLLASWGGSCFFNGIHHHEASCNQAEPGFTLVFISFVQPGVFADRPGGHVISSQLFYRYNNPGRGDLVIFKAPGDTKRAYLKRIVGLPGEAGLSPLPLPKKSANAVGSDIR